MQGSETRRRAQRGLGVAAMVGGLIIGVAPTFAATASTNAVQPASVTAVCEDSGPLTQKGSSTISGPMATALASTPVPLSLTGETEAPAAIEPGDAIDYQVALTLDLQALAAEVLEDTIKPAVAGTSAALAGTAALNLRIADLTARLQVPAGTSVVGTPTASTSAGGPTAAASVVADEVVIELGPILANAGSPSSVTTTTTPGTPAFDILVDFTVDTAGTSVGATLDLVPGAIDFSFEGPSTTQGGFNVSVNFLGSEIAGGVDGPLACTTSDTPIASTAVVDSTTTTTTEEPTVTTEGPTTSDSTPTTAGPTTTEGPSQTTGPTSTTDPTALAYEASISRLSFAPGESFTVAGEVISGPGLTSRAADDPTVVSVAFAGEDLGDIPIEDDRTFSGSFTVPNLAPGTYLVVTDYLGGEIEFPVTVTQASVADTRTCTEIGRVNIPTGDADYRPDLDADSDGVACEDVGGNGTSPSSFSASTPLARTGTSTVPMLAAGLGLIAVGAVVTHRSRRQAV